MVANMCVRETKLVFPSATVMKMKRRLCKGSIEIDTKFCRPLKYLLRPSFQTAPAGSALRVNGLGRTAIALRYDDFSAPQHV